ncbi:hypothetical protein HK102_001710 [Quaeritorhiza haematococci]|nr:hypothetical protein HK102_001710 [Quaeritorhiza haematococci]
MFRVLIEAGANVNELNGNNGQLLIDACAAGNVDLFKFLLAEGAEAHVRNGQALVIAAKDGHLEIVKALLGAGIGA